MTNEEKLAASLANVNAAYDALLAAIAENPYSREAVDCHDAWREAGMAYENDIEMDIEQQSRRFREIPSTLVDVCDMGSEILVLVETVCGLYRESHKVATFATMLDATAFVASTYGLTRQAMDGDGATEGWWLS